MIQRQFPFPFPSFYTFIFFLSLSFLLLLLFLVVFFPSLAPFTLKLNENRRNGEALLMSLVSTFHNIFVVVLFLPSLSFPRPGTFEENWRKADETIYITRFSFFLYFVTLLLSLAVVCPFVALFESASEITGGNSDYIIFILRFLFSLNILVILPPILSLLFFFFFALSSHFSPARLKKHWLNAIFFSLSPLNFLFSLSS